MKALQTDYFSVPARTLVPLLSKIQIDKALAKEAQARLSGWEFVLSPNSVEAGIYAIWEREIMSHAREKFIPSELMGLVSIQLTRIIRWLENPDHRFGSRPIAGRDAFLRTTFEMAIEELKEKLGDSIDHWQYGQEKYKHITLVNHLPGLLHSQVKEKVDLGPLPRGGNGHTPNATGSSDNQSSGASFRILVDVGDWDKTLMINTPGQSADPLSPFYDNLFELWARDEYFPSYYSRDKIEQVTQQRILMTPGKGKNK
jgi:penicillin amidase